MIKANKLAVIDISDITNELLIFNKKRKSSDNIRPLDIKLNNKQRFLNNRTVTKWKNSIAIALGKYIFLCIKEDNTWKIFRHNFSFKVHRCVCIDKLKLLVAQKNKQLLFFEFLKVYKNKQINDIKIIRSSIFHSPILFFYVYEDNICFIDTDGKLQSLDASNVFAAFPTLRELHKFSIKHSVDLYFKIEKKKRHLVVAYYDNKKELIHICIYGIKKNKIESLIETNIFTATPQGEHTIRPKKHIECITYNSTYVIILFDNNDVIILKGVPSGEEDVQYQLYKYVSSNKASQLKYFNKKSLEEIENSSFENVNKINNIASLSLNDDNNLMIIFSDLYLPEFSFSNNKYHKYFAPIDKIIRIVNYQSKVLLRKVLFNLRKKISKYVDTQTFNTNSIITDMNQQLIENATMDICALSIVDKPFHVYAGMDLNFNDEIFNSYKNTIKLYEKCLQKRHITNEVDYEENLLNILRSVPDQLDIHKIDQTKRQILYDKITKNSEKGFLNIDFLKEITKNKNNNNNNQEKEENDYEYDNEGGDDDGGGYYENDASSYNTIYLCNTNNYFVILQNWYTTYKICIYEMKLLNQVQFFVYLFFHNYYYSILLTEAKCFHSLNQFFVYSVYDSRGRYFEASLLDFQCLFKIRNIFHFLQRAIRYDPFLFREEENQHILKNTQWNDTNIKTKINTKNNTNVDKQIDMDVDMDGDMDGDIGTSCKDFEEINATNLYLGEQNNNYDNFFYVICENSNEISKSKYVCPYYCVKKINKTNSSVCNLDIQLYKLKMVLSISLKRIQEILNDDESKENQNEQKNVEETSSEYLISSTESNATVTNDSDNESEENENENENENDENSEENEVHEYEENEQDEENEENEQDEGNEEDEFRKFLIAQTHQYEPKKNKSINNKKKKKTKKKHTPEDKYHITDDIYDIIDQEQIEDVWGVEINYDEIENNSRFPSLENSNDITEKRKENKKKTTENEKWIYENIYKKQVYDFLDPLEKENVKTKLRLYKKEILNQIYKYRCYKYLMKLLDKEKTQTNKQKKRKCHTYQHKRILTHRNYTQHTSDYNSSSNIMKKTVADIRSLFTKNEQNNSYANEIKDKKKKIRENEQLRSDHIIKEIDIEEEEEEEEKKKNKRKRT